MNVYAKIFNTVLANQTPQYVKWMVYDEQVGLTPGKQNKIFIIHIFVKGLVSRLHTLTI